MSAHRQFRAAVEHPDIVQAQEAALEYIVSQTIFAVDPPGKVDQKLGESIDEKLQISFTVVAFLVTQVDLDDGVGMHRRIDVAEVPLVCRHLPVGMNRRSGRFLNIDKNQAD